MKVNHLLQLSLYTTLDYLYLMDGWKASEATVLHKAAKECWEQEKKSYWGKITPSDHQLIIFLKFNSIFICISILNCFIIEFYELVEIKRNFIVHFNFHNLPPSGNFS